MNDNVASDEVVALGRLFLESLVAQDFDRLVKLFAPQVRFRALLPSRIREEQTVEAAVGWLRHWFGEADRLQVLQSAIDQVGDRSYLRYRLRLHSAKSNWEIIEQHAYYAVQDAPIDDLWLLCSGFRPDPDVQDQSAQAHFNADAFYDADIKGCADGPLDEIAGYMRRLNSGQTLEIRALAPSVAGDLPAWCRMAGHELLKHEGEHYLIRRK